MIKRTLQEIANFFDMAVTVDKDGAIYMHPITPIRSSCNWYNHGEDIFPIERDLVEFSGDWRDSLALPESRPQFTEGELVIHCLDEEQIVVWPPAMDKSEDLWRRPTAEEKQR